MNYIYPLIQLFNNVITLIFSQHARTNQTTNNRRLRFKTYGEKTSLGCSSQSSSWSLQHPGTTPRPQQMTMPSKPPITLRMSLYYRRRVRVMFKRIPKLYSVLGFGEIKHIFKLHTIFNRTILSTPFCVREANL